MGDLHVQNPELEFSLRREDGGLLVLRGVSLPHAMQMYCKGGTPLTHIDFNGWDFTGLILISIKFEGCSFEGARGRPCFEGCEFTMCSFIGASFVGGVFCRCEFIAMAMRNSEFVEVEFDRCLFWECHMQDARIDGSDLYRSTLDSCELQRASLKRVKGSDVKFRRSVMQGATLEDSFFGPDQCEFTENDMRDTRWRGAFCHLKMDFGGNDVDGADMRGAAVTCANSVVGRALWYVMPRTFTFGPRTRLPLAPLPWLYARPGAVGAAFAATLVAFVVGVAVA